MHYKLEPEVAGHLGSGTVMDASTHPPIVHALHYEFDGWLGDELLTAFPCFIVTENLRQLIESANPSGCRFDRVRVSRSEEFEELYPDQQLPAFSWLIVDGTARRDDFGTSPTGGALIVSERMLQVMKRARLQDCRISGA
jgi:hypothetical protein